MISHVTRPFRLSLALPFLISAAFLPVSRPMKAQTAPIAVNPILPGPKPPDAPPEWKGILGIYGSGKDALILLESDQQLYLIDQKKSRPALSLEGNGRPKYSADSIQLNDCFSILPADRGKTRYLLSCLNSRQPLPRTDAGSDPSQFYHVTPTRSVEELRKKALTLSPPAEAGPFRKPDLVELATLNPAIHLDIRYASARNFLSTPVYTQARAFMQRPAAEALVRALHKLQPLGYGLLIHDAYRPWYVTKIFWDATPPEGKIFVADPQQGSKHNRGCAVDLTLYDLSTGQPIEMPGLYDEMSPRSFPNFPGGTSLQRWHRDLLRRAMESEGFTVNEDEWWHFDYKDWKQYGILNVPFEKIAASLQPTAISH
jgi:D-alanyl-D-alanine dipeptidase